MNVFFVDLKTIWYLLQDILEIKKVNRSNSSRIFSRFFSIVRDLLLFNDKWFGNDGIDSPKA